MSPFLLIFLLLEKVCVLIASAVLLIAIRPARIWLTQTGRHASIRRRVVIFLVSTLLAVWGTSLGIQFDGLVFNLHLMGIIVAGFLGGRRIGIVVGALAGLSALIPLPPPFLHSTAAAAAFLLLSAGVGLLAGFWSRSRGTSMRTVITASFTLELVYYLFISLISIFGVDLSINDLWPHPFAQLMNLSVRGETYPIMLYGAEFLANWIGVALFMGVLNEAMELEGVRERARRTEEKLRNAQLDALQKQLRPHFLFNILNTLRYLIRTNPDNARELTTLLSEYMRDTVYIDSSESTLQMEVAQLRRYVELERTRFGDHLFFEAPSDLGPYTNLLIPPLVLQPLVENAIQAAVKSGDDNKGSVILHIHTSEKGLELIILDNGQGFDKIEKIRRFKYQPGMDAGRGLENVAARLEHFFEGGAELEIGNRRSTNGRVIGAYQKVVISHKWLANKKAWKEAK